MLQHSYSSAYAPAYPAYPSGLLILSRFTNARYARLDVPDWEFRARPGKSLRTDPSGVISRGRSCVRIKTRVGKNPGARLVEKFIIREPGGAQGFGFGKIGLASDRAKAVSGEAGRGARGCSAGDVPEDRPQTRSRAQRAETAQSGSSKQEDPQFLSGAVRNTQDESQNPGSTHLKSPTPAVSTSSASTYSSKPDQIRENPGVLCDAQQHKLKSPDLGNEPLRSPTPQAEPPKSASAETKESTNQEQNPTVSCDLRTQLLESLATDRTELTSTQQTNPAESTSPKTVKSTNKQENPPLSSDAPQNKEDQPSQGVLATEEDRKSADSSPKATKKKLAKSKKTDLLKKREPDKDRRTICVTGDCEDISVHKAEDKCDVTGETPSELPKLLSFTAQAPDGVKKVKPLKVENQVSRPVSGDNFNGISEAKVEGPVLNAKCVEAKTKSRVGATIISCVIGGEGEQGSQTPELLNTGKACGSVSVQKPHDAPVPAENRRNTREPLITKAQVEAPSKLVDGVGSVNQVPTAELTVPLDNKFDSVTGISEATEKCNSQQENQVNAPKALPVSAEKTPSGRKPADRVIDVNRCAGAPKDDSESANLKKNSAFTCVKQDLKYQRRKTVEPVKTSAELQFQNRSTTGGSEIKNTVEDARGLKLLQNSERLDQDCSNSVELNETKVVSGEKDIRRIIKDSVNCAVVDGCELKGADVNQVVSEALPSPNVKVFNQNGGILLTGVVEENESKGVNSEEKRDKKQQNIVSNSVNYAVENGCELKEIVCSGDAVENSKFRVDSNQNGSVADQLKFKKTKSENNSSGVSSNDAGDKAVSKDKKVKKVIKKKSNKENNCDGNNKSNVLSLRCLDDLKELFEEYKVVSEVHSSVEVGWELLEVVVDMEGVKKKKKVIVKKKGSKVKVTPLEAKPPTNPAETASPGDIMRQLSKKRVSLADEDLNLVGFTPDKRMSITDEVLVEEAALLDKMIKKEMKDARKSSLAFPPISEELADKEVEDLARETLAKTPSPKRVVPSPQERREMWKKNALRKSLKSLGGFFKKNQHSPTPSSSSESGECDVNCHQKCMELMPNLCGVNQKLMVEALLNLRRGRRSASGPHSRPSLFKIDSESEGGQGDGRVTPPAPPAKTLPRFRTYTITDFQFLKVLGKGSFGKVLLAELKGSQCYYAVKCLKKDVVLEDDDVECTMIERKVLALGTGHPYFCHLFCTFQTESHLFFVMEYLNGGDLMFHIQQSGRFDEGRARFYAAEIVSALAFLHKLGIVYRDLKLDNVLLDFDGHIRIADFGMCKLQIYLDKTTDTFCGTPDYMAPEIIKGLRYNQCVDWWSFGILLYEMLVGQSPFSGCDEDHLFWSICNERPHMPRHLSQPAVAVLKDLLEKDWTKRLGSSEFGSQDVMNHSFFDGMKWHLLERRQIDPPYKPTTKHPLDTKYFDRAFTSEKPTLTPVDKAILESMDQTQFEGFSYTNPNATE